MIQFTDMNVAGFIPAWLNEEDDRSAVQQLAANYTHGGGWRNFQGFTLEKIGGGAPMPKEHAVQLAHAGDPPTVERSRGWLRGELVVVFDYGWVAVIQTDNSLAVARMD